jgi:hypothetical protein
MTCICSCSKSRVQKRNEAKGDKNLTKALFSFKGVKFWNVTSDVSGDVGMGVRILIKKLITELAYKL